MLGIGPHSSFVMFLGQIAALARRGLLLQMEWCSNCEPCKSGRTSHHAVWDFESDGPKDACIRWGPDTSWEGAVLRRIVSRFSHTSHWAPFPLALTSGFPCMLSTSVLLSQSQKQLSVTLNVPNEKSTWCRLSSKFFEYLFCFRWTRWFVLPIVSSRIIVVYQYLNKFKFYEAKIFCKLSLNIMFDFVTWTLQCIWEQKGTVTCLPWGAVDE